MVDEEPPPSSLLEKLSLTSPMVLGEFCLNNIYICCKSTQTVSHSKQSYRIIFCASNISVHMSQFSLLLSEIMVLLNLVETNQTLFQIVTRG